MRIDIVQGKKHREHFALRVDGKSVPLPLESLTVGQRSNGKSLSRLCQGTLEYRMHIPWELGRNV